MKLSDDLIRQINQDFYNSFSSGKFDIGTSISDGIDDAGLASSADVAALGTIHVFTSTAGAGGAATAAMVLTGLLASDTILAVMQKTPGANSLPLIGYSTQANNALTAIWSADPGAGSVIVVSVKR